MATQHIRPAMRLVPAATPAAGAEENGERLVIRGRLSCLSYTSHDYLSDEQQTVSTGLGRFVATLFLVSATSARLYRYDSLLHAAQRAGAITRVEFVAYDPAGKELLTDTFFPGRDDGDEEFVSHDEIWRAGHGANNALHLQRFASDQFVELMDEDSDVPLWEGKSISFCRDALPDVSRAHVSDPVQEFLPRKKPQGTSEGYFSYTHDFKGKINEFHWVLMGLITDVTPMLISVSGSGIV